MTRSHPKYVRIYANGVDISGYARSAGTAGVGYDVSPDASLTDGVKNIIPGTGNVVAGPINVFLDNDAAGAFNLASAGTGEIGIVIAVGSLAEPTEGDPVFCWNFNQSSYTMEPSESFVAANIVLGGPNRDVLNYTKPWGLLLHEKILETDVNSATGIDCLASSSNGGVFVYQLLTSDGTVTLSAEDADTNVDGSFAAITGATSGEIDASASPVYGMVQLSTSETIERYIRWQLSFGTATAAMFVAALIRA